MLIFPINIYLKGTLLIWTATFSTGNAVKIKGQLPDSSLISTLFNMFMKPYLRTSYSQPTLKTFAETAVEKAIRQKIKQLQPFLQDTDPDITDKENKFTFEGNEETTILEFIPVNDTEIKTDIRSGNNTLQANMQKYKKVRNKIYEELQKESVSDKTIALVMKTLDELIGKMIETQCHWRGDTNVNLENYNRLIIPRTIINAWKDEWQKFKAKFLFLHNYRGSDQFSNSSLLSHLSGLNSVINDVTENLETFSQKYKIRCKIAENDRYKSNEPVRRYEDAIKFTQIFEPEDKTLCKYFKVCSTELKMFFMDFYNAINRTAVNVLRGYGEMFNRDVNSDESNEKDSIVTLIYKIGDQVEKDIIKIFVNYTSEFKLDEHRDKDANVMHISDFVTNIIRHIRDEISKCVVKKLKKIHTKVSTNIQEDVEMNLNVDLNNLESDFINRICLIFNVCNGVTKARRSNGWEDNNIDRENKIYVRVELTLDEDALKSNSVRRIPVLQNVESTSTKMNLEKYANISVTRTTLLYN